MVLALSTKFVEKIIKCIYSFPDSDSSGKSPVSFVSSTAAPRVRVGAPREGLLERGAERLAGDGPEAAQEEEHGGQ